MRLARRWAKLKQRWSRRRHGNQATETLGDEELGEELGVVRNEPAADAPKDETQAVVRPVDQTPAPQSNASPSSTDLTPNKPRGGPSREAQFLADSAFPRHSQSLAEVIQRAFQQNSQQIQQQGPQQGELQDQHQSQSEDQEARELQDREERELQDQQERELQYRQERERQGRHNPQLLRQEQGRPQGHWEFELHGYRQRELPSQQQHEHQGQQRCGYQGQHQGQHQNDDAISKENEGPMTPVNSQTPTAESVSDAEETV